MKFRIEKSIQALRDVEESFVFIGSDNSDIAFDFLDSVERTCELLAAHPFAGSERTYGNPKLSQIRFFPVSGYSRYLIFYEPVAELELIRVHRIVHSRRDLERLFS